MFIDVREVLSGLVDSIEFDYTLPAPAGFNDITFPGEVRVVGAIKNQAGYMTLSAKATVPYKTHCARCTKDISGVFEKSFERPLATRLENDDDDYLMIKHGEIDLDTPLLEELIVSLDFVYLCKEDCKGLCFKCGKDLNDGDCGCADHKEIDPRLAILAKLLDN